MKSKNMKVGASVVLYNTNESQLNRLLRAINDSKLIDIIYLIDNSPSPASSKFYSLPNIRYKKNSKNTGYGAGHNIALRESLLVNNYHFVLNPDIYFEPEEIHKMLNKISSDDCIGQLMPKVYYPSGEIQYLCKLVPTPFDLILRRFFPGPLKNLFENQKNRFELRFTGYNKEMNVPYLSGCFMLFRSTSLADIGLFDERFFMYPEDIDITRRMHAKYKTIYFPSAIIFHDHAKDSYKSFRMFWIHMTNLIKYFNKWGWLFDSERVRFNKRALNSLKDTF